MQRLPNIHPGEILLEDFLKPMEMTQYRLAKNIGVAQRRVGEIVTGQRAVTPDTALRLGRFFGNGANIWLRLQAAYDLEEAENAGDYQFIEPYQYEQRPDA